jgi:hypothetical protein
MTCKANDFRQREYQRKVMNLPRSAKKNQSLLIIAKLRAEQYLIADPCE